MHLHLILRYRSETSHGPSLMPFSVDYAVAAMRGLRSVLVATSDALAFPPLTGARLTVIADQVPHGFAAEVAAMAAARSLATEVVALGAVDQCAVVRASYRLARESAGELIYMASCLDLHSHEALTEMILAARQAAAAFGTDPVLTPADPLEDYHCPNLSQLFLCSRRYWRTTRHRGAPMLMSRAILDHYGESLEAIECLGGAPLPANGGHLGRDIPCLAPLPALSIPLPEGLGAPFVDWRTWWSDAARPLAPTSAPMSSGPALTHAAPQPVATAPAAPAPATLKPSAILAKHKLRAFLDGP